MKAERLAPDSGQLIAHGRPMIFFWQGREVQGLAGDTIASALLSAGIQAFGRSFKYHRPRGPFCLAGQCGRCLVQVDGEPNVRACRTLVRPGMRVEPHNVSRAGALDPRLLADKLPWALPTGFYYKALHKPAFIWPLAAGLLRRSAGLGRLELLEKPGRFELVHLFPDVLVVGGGLAGLSAALTAAQAGVRVALVEAEFFVGGREALEGPAAGEILSPLLQAASAAPNIQILTGTFLAAAYPDNLFVAHERPWTGEEPLERIWLLRPRTAVLAVGAAERPLVFGHNDRPGVFSPGAVQRLIRLYGLKPGDKAVLSGLSDDLYRAAQTLLQAGVEVVALADARPGGFPDLALSALARSGVAFLPGFSLVRVWGKKGLEGAELRRGQAGGPIFLEADLVAASAGPYPAFKLPAQAGIRWVFDPNSGRHRPEEPLPPGRHLAGRVLGLDEPEAIAAQGRLAGLRAIKDLGLERPEEIRAAEYLLARHLAPGRPDLPPPLGARSRSFVCFCGDVTLKDVEKAQAEGFGGPEQAKRYTTAGMGPCQGGLCQASLSELLAAPAVEPSSRPLTTVRPPLTPLSFGALAGPRHHPVKLSPLHHIQAQAGARFFRAGAWWRVEDFGRPEAEALAVRRAAGLTDVSTLGKFRVHGPDAGKLLDRIYTRRVSDLEPGRILYVAACNEAGVMIDDGVIVKIKENDFYLTTSSARAAATREWFGRFRRDRDWQVFVANLTDCRAAMNLAGPRAREILAGLTEADVSNQVLPFMRWRQADLDGVPALILRMGFLGELSYELHVPSSQGTYLWEKILYLGRDLGLEPVGLEAQNICRLEKGHLIVGLDTDGQLSLLEAGLDRLWDRTKTETVGGPMLRHLLNEPLRRRVVGFRVPGRAGVKEGFLVKDSGRRAGQVTSVRYSPTLSETVGLALVDVPQSGADPAAAGRLKLAGEGREVEAEAAEPPFYDPAGERMRS